MAPVSIIWSSVNMELALKIKEAAHPKTYLKRTNRSVPPVRSRRSADLHVRRGVVGDGPSRLECVRHLQLLDARALLLLWQRLPRGDGGLLERAHVRPLDGQDLGRVGVLVGPAGGEDFLLQGEGTWGGSGGLWGASSIIITKVRGCCYVTVSWCLCFNGEQLEVKPIHLESSLDNAPLSSPATPC